MFASAVSRVESTVIPSEKSLSRAETFLFCLDRARERKEPRIRNPVRKRSLSFLESMDFFKDIYMFFS